MTKSDCIEVGYLQVSGYRMVWRNGGAVYAHRTAWVEQVGPIPKGLVVDHLCRNRRCSNIKHLRVTTQRKNILSGTGASASNAKKKFCNAGHALFGENLAILARGERRCKACHRERNRLSKQKRMSNAQ